MTKLRSTSIALFLAVATFALGACGDDKGSNESATTGADTTAGGTTETGTTETGTTKTGTTKKRTGTGKTETGKRKRDDKGGSGGGSDDSSGGGKSGSGSSPEKELSGKNVYSTSKTVCSSFLPTALEQDLKSGDKSAEDIAKDYSQGYPAEERKRAHDGCLAGLKGKG